MATVAKNDEISVTREDLYRFRKTTSAHKADMDDARTEIANAHKDMIDNKGCNKKGLNIFKSLDNMKPNKRADALRTLDKLRSLSGNDWAVGDLVDAAENAPEEKPPENVVPLKSAAQAASEIMDEAI